jgi:hypothetical protein
MPRQAAPVLAATVGFGLLLGGAISLSAFYVARYGPSGGNWSFQGNGAIAVYAAFPAVLAAGWTAIAVHARGGASWFWRGVGAGVVGLLIAFVAAAILPLAGEQADVLGSPIAFIALLVWMVVAPVAATRVRVAASGAGGSVGLHVGAGVLWFAAVLAGLVAIGIVLPAGS